MADGATLDPADINVVLGTHRVSGYAAGTFVSVTYDVDSFAKLVGIDGEGVYVKSANRGAVATLTLIQTARSNLVLSALLAADQNTPGGLMFPFSIREQGGTTLFQAARARLTRLPDVNYSDAGETRAWAVTTTRMLGLAGDRGATPLVGGVDPDNLSPF